MGIWMSSSEEEMEDMEEAMAAGFIPADFSHVSAINWIENTIVALYPVYVFSQIYFYFLKLLRSFSYLKIIILVQWYLLSFLGL